MMSDGMQQSASQSVTLSISERPSSLPLKYGTMCKHGFPSIESIQRSPVTCSGRTSRRKTVDVGTFECYCSLRLVVMNTINEDNRTHKQLSTLIITQLFKGRRETRISASKASHFRTEDSYLQQTQVYTLTLKNVTFTLNILSSP